MKKTSFRTWLFLWLPVLAWAAMIYSLSAIPHLRFFDENLVDFIFRKAGHMLEYAVLARLLARAFTGSTFWPWKKIFIWSLVLSVLFSSSDEFHQRFVAGRSGSRRDVLIDGAGAWLGLGLLP